MRHLILLALLLAPSLSAAQQTVPLGPNPVMAGGIFQPGGGGITVAAELRETADGQMAVCGVWARSTRLNVYARTRARDTLGPAEIRIDGQPVRRDLRAFPRVDAATAYAGAPARCLKTDLAWDPAARLSISVPRQVLHLDPRNGGGGYRIILHRTDEKNPALRAGSILPERWIGILPGLGGST